MFFPIETLAFLLYLELYADYQRPLFVIYDANNPVSAIIGFILLVITAYCASELVVRTALKKINYVRTSAVYISKIEILLKIMLIVFAVFTTEGLGIPIICKNITGDTTGIVFRLSGLIPFLTICIAVWLPQVKLQRCLSANTWAKSSYILHRARYSLFMLAVWIPIVVLSGLLQKIEKFDAIYSIGSLGILIVLVWIFPAVLRTIWGCKVLPEGEVRMRIQKLAEKTNVRFNQIYIWNLGGSTLLNAAAVGIFKPFRYLLISRGLLNTLTPNEIDAVVLHEMGHVKHRHLPFFFLITISILPYFIAAISNFFVEYTPAVQLIISILALILFFRFGFGYFIRKFERQADLFALETTGQANDMCMALEHLADASGQSRHNPSWHHGSIAERVMYLKNVEGNPHIGTNHHKSVSQARWITIILAVIILGTSINSWNKQQDHIKPSQNAAFKPSLEYRLKMVELFPESFDHAIKLADTYLELKHWKKALEIAVKAKQLAASHEEELLVKKVFEKIHSVFQNMKQEQENIL